MRQVEEFAFGAENWKNHAAHFQTSRQLLRILSRLRNSYLAAWLLKLLKFFDL